MRRRFRLEPLIVSLLASVALTPALSCGGSSNVEGGGGATSAELGVCKNPVTIDASGWIRCDGGLAHRETLGTCSSTIPRENPITPIAPCWDADCAHLPYGHCWSPDPTWAGATCIPGCVSDADCGADEVCLCEPPVGRCVPSDCSVDADCGSNAFCATYFGPPEPACTFHIAGVACQKQGDACVGGECNCAMVQGERQCVDGIGGCGRPFLVAGTERRACAEARRDWSTPLVGAPRVDGLSPDARARLAEHWTLAGLLEHASIAAFARFSLELLALGAPPELVADATRAMADETRHAQACFSLAAAYGTPVGPGPLAVGDCLDVPSLESVVRTVLLEGCIGETVAAAEARELARTASDPVVREMLAAIAVDETRHAALAYRFVRWALDQGSADLSRLTRDELARELAKARADLAGSDDQDERDALALGLPTPAFRAALRRDVLERVVGPCLEALLRETPRTRGASAGIAHAS